MVSACGDHMTFLTAYLQEDKQTLLSTCPVYEARYLASVPACFLTAEPHDKQRFHG